MPLAGGPRYREAYPQLDILRAKAALDRGHSICDFKDRWGEAHGIARLEIRGDRCRLEYHFHFPHIEICTDWIELALKPVLNGTAKNRAMIICPACKNKKRILFFKDIWACATCLKLLFRSQLIHPLSKLWEKSDELTRRLRNGKPHRMHNKTYANLLDRVAHLEEKLYGKVRRYASDKYCESVSYTWRLPAATDSVWFLSAKPALAGAEAGTSGGDLSGCPLISPVVPDESTRRPFEGGYEATDPEEM